MRWKRVLGVAILIIVVLIAAVWVIVANYDYNKLKPEIESAFREATGRSLTLKGNLDLKIGLSPTLVVRDAALQNASWGSRPEMAKIERFEVQLSLVPLIFHDIEVKRLVLANPDILIETNPQGASNLDFLKKMSTGGTKKEAHAASKVKLTVNEVSIKDGRLTYRNGKSSKVYTITLQRFDASAGSATSPLKVALNGSYEGASFEATGNLVPLAGLTDTGRPWPFDMTLSGPGVSLSLGGTIKDVANFQGLDAKVAVKSKDLSRIGELVGAKVPVQGPLEMSCRLTDLRPEVYRISELKAVAAGSDLEGTLAIDVSRPRPALTADLRSNKLDVRPFLGKEKASKPERRDRIFPDSPLPLEPLQTADATVSLKATEILSPNVALHNLGARVALKDGRLFVKPLTAAVGGGSLEGSIDLDSRGKIARLETALTVSQLDVGAMLGELKKPNVLEGRMNIRLNVTGSGGSVAGIMSGLSGMTYAIMGKGRINNKYLGLLGGDISSNILRMINPFSKESASTEVSCIVCGFRIKSGVAETTALVVNSDYMSVVGKGTINLRTEALDFNLNPVPKQGVGTGITGKLSLSVGELTRPFKLAGTLAHPSFGVDVEQAALAAGKAVGGLVLLGPLGLGSALVGESSDDKQLCPLAMKAAEQGVPLSLEKKGGKGIVGKTTQGVEKDIGKLGQGLKKLFGR